MRISSLMMYSQLQQGFDSDLSKIFDAQQQLSTGLKINKPSDDPIGMREALDYKVTISANNQYENNMNDAKANLNATETALNSVVDNLQKLNELNLESINGANGPQDRIDMATQVDVIRQALYALSNSKYNNQALFSGYKLRTNSYATSGNFYVYQGDSNLTHVNISPTGNVIRNICGSDAFSYSIPTTQTILLNTGTYAHYIPTASASNPSVNTTQITVVLSTSSNPAVAGYDSVTFSNYMEMTGDIENALNSNDVDMATALLSCVTHALDKSATVQSVVGARLNYLNTVDTNNQNTTLFTQQLLSSTEDADIAKVTTNFSEGQTSLQALMESSSQILSQSLFNFLK